MHFSEAILTKMEITEPDWLMLPALVQTRLMLEVGLTSLETLHICRQVCQAWNNHIVTNIWGNDSNTKKLEDKLKQCWRTGTPQYVKTERIFDSPIEILAVSGDSLVLIDPSNRLNLRIFHRNEDEWTLKAKGKVRECFVTKEILVLVTKNEIMALEMEIYELCSRAKIMEKILVFDYPTHQIKIFCDGCLVFLVHKREIINALDPSSSFKCNSLFNYIDLLKSARIISFQFPLFLVHDNKAQLYEVFRLDATNPSKSCKISEFDDGGYLSSAKDATFLKSKPVLLRDKDVDAASGSLTLHNANGEEVGWKWPLHDADEPYWCHGYGKIVITFGNRSRKTQTVLLYHEEDLVREDYGDCDFVPREFEFSEKNRKMRNEFDAEGYDDAVTAMNRTCIKRYRTNNKSLEIEMLKLWQ